MWVALLGIAALFGVPAFADSTWPTAQMLSALLPATGTCEPALAAAASMSPEECAQALPRVDPECRSVLAFHLPERVSQAQGTELRSVIELCRLARLRGEDFHPEEHL